jgi:hypothetical protein
MDLVTSSYPWEDPSAPSHVRSRQRVWNLSGPVIRIDLPKRRPAVELPRALQGLSYGAVIMSHNGHSNGRLSVLLSSLPENLPVVVSSDAIDENEVVLDRTVAEFHGADFSHSTPWSGRAGNAIHCMACTNWAYTLFLNDDVWLAPETTIDALRWAYIYRVAGIPLASLAIPGWETYREHPQWGFESWQQCLDEPWRFEAVPPNPAFLKAPCLYKNPFGAAMLIMRDAYDDLGGFDPRYWAQDDVWNHKVWLSGKYVNAAYPGRGYLHLGAQSNHFGETPKYIGEFKDATGMTAEESGKLQVESIYRWKERLGSVFLRLGGTEAV